MHGVNAERLQARMHSGGYMQYGLAGSLIVDACVAPATPKIDPGTQSLGERLFSGKTLRDKTNQLSADARLVSKLRPLALGKNTC